MGANSSEKRSRTAVEFLQSLGEQNAFPLTADFELTRRCNLRCEHCFIDFDGDSGLSFDEILRVFDDLRKAGTLFLVLSGGEIATRPDWLEIIHEAHARNFVLRIKTNGTLFTSEDIAELAKIPILSVDISLYGGDAKTHDKVTKIKGSFERTIKTIKRLRKAGIRVMITAPVLSSTSHALPQIAALSKKYDCNLTTALQIAGTLNGQRDNAHTLPNQAQMAHAIAVMEDYGVKDSADPNESLEKQAVWECLQAPCGLLIKSDGQVWHCPLLPLSFGSVKDRPIDEIWRESETRVRLYQGSTQKPNVCESCDAEWACHRCAGLAWIEHGSLDFPATADCQLAKVRSGRGTNALKGKCDSIFGCWGNEPHKKPT